MTTCTTTLAVTLGGRELGIAIFASHGPLALQVLNLRKLRTHEGREARFRARLDELAQTHAVGRVIAVVPDARTVDAQLVAAQRAWLGLRTTELAVELVEQSRADVIRTAVGRDRAGVRDLAAVLQDREPSLWSFLPSAAPVPGEGIVPGLTWRTRRIRSPRERYWSNALVAAAAARAASQQPPYARVPAPDAT